jgi:hypothetical protein
MVGGSWHSSAGTHPKYTKPRKLSISCFVTPGISIGEESDVPSVVPEDPPAPPMGNENISAKI